MVTIKKKLLAALCKCAAEESARYSMTCVRVTETSEEVRLDATDGKQLCVLRVRQEDQDVVAPFRYQPPAKELAEACRAKGEEVTMELAEKGAVSVLCGNHCATLSEVEGRYPEIGAVIPKRPPAAEVNLDPARLKLLCEVALALQAGEDKRTGELPRVTLKLMDLGTNEGPVCLSARGPDGEVLDMLLMPLT